MADIKSYAARVWRKVRRAVPGARSRDAAAKLKAELVTERERTKKLRAELRTSKAETRRLKVEFSETRNSVRDPNPRLALGDDVEHVIEQVRAEKLSYLSAPSLRMLARLALSAEQTGLPGLVIEAGTALGGSAIVLAAAKAADRPMKVYDVFDMIPPPTEQDGEDVHQRYATITAGAATGVGGDDYYGYRDDLYAEVTASFERLGVEAEAHHVELIRGLFADTIHLDEPVALAHLDGDWYESTMTCLERITPMLVPGGRIVLDDYFAWTGCRQAVDEYFAGRSGYLLEQRTKLHVVKL